jgi:hypothetical protein
MKLPFVYCIALEIALAPTAVAQIATSQYDNSRERTRVLDVQFDIHRKLADVASGAKIVGAGDAYGTDHRQQQFA